MRVETISAETLQRIARKVFGGDAVVRCSRAIEPSKNHGITETPPSTRNLLYVVELEGRSEPLVFRFSRGPDDVYRREVHNYRLLAEKTGVRVPAIFEIDTSRKIVDTSYMVMEYLHGKLWNYVAHPNNPNTGAAEKAAVGRAVGRFYSDVHAVEEESQQGAEAQTLLYAMDRLEAAAARGNVPATARDIDRCRQAILSEPAFQTGTRSLCLADSEVHVGKEGSEWRVAFVCDAEWVGFRHPSYDLTQLLGGPEPWWKVDVPAPHLDPSLIAQRPFFREYGLRRSVDFDELLRVSAYHQLALWAYVAMSSRAPEKVGWIKSKAPLLMELIHIVGHRITAAETL